MTKNMEIKELSKYSTAEKILLAEKIWDSISKNDIELSNQIKKELDDRLHILEEGNVELYSLEDVKKHIQKSRKK
ncbi:addiction module protein [Flavobacterium sp.]|jgi:putative addiction module component (TIGR02574 family)|uniref:addiction module protein n=1 Tax=Flavobacterium sp. TaxID=239 RepID=UPI0035B2C79F